MPELVSGDLCSFSQTVQYGVVHYRCDDYRDGTITNTVTGQVVQHAPYNALRGFYRPDNQPKENV